MEIFNRDEYNSRKSINRTPADHGRTLFLPAPKQMPRDLRKNISYFSEVKIPEGDANLERAVCRQELIEKASRYSKKIGLEPAGEIQNKPLIVTGHQCQFYHGGILIKYLLLQCLAQDSGGTGLNLIIDNDLPKKTPLEIPFHSEDGLGLQQTGFGQIDTEKIMEFQPLPTAKEIDLFLQELEKTPTTATIQKKISQLRQVVRKAYKRSDNLRDLYTQINHGMADGLRLRWLELPVSVMSGSDSFLRFAASMMKNLHRVRNCYNRALREFRGKHKICGSLRPVPDLAGEENEKGRQELPFWIIEKGKRQPLYGKFLKERLFLSNGIKNLAEFPIDYLEKQEELNNIFTKHRIAIRPRALTLTIFARLFFADYFIHGIGGAIYDQVTDNFIREFYQCEPPLFACASATLHLPLGNYPSFEQTREESNKLQRAQRDWQYNPQIFFEKAKRGEALEKLIIKRAQAITASDNLRKTRAASSERAKAFKHIRELNQEIAGLIPEVKQKLQDQQHALEKQIQEAKIAYHREYFFGLFEPEIFPTLLHVPNQP